MEQGEKKTAFGHEERKQKKQQLFLFLSRHLGILRGMKGPTEYDPI